MKRVLSFLAFTLLFSNCDDGNLVQKSISFEEVQTQNCTTNNIIYKIKDQEALLLEIPNTTFKNEPTGDNPIILNISTSSNRVVYRFYDGSINSNNICETLPPAKPYISDQWVATDGKIQITTTSIKSTNTVDNSTRITGYNHNIIFKNITFDRNNGTQVYETFPFGDYKTSATSLSLAFDKTLEKCSNSNVIYNYNSSEALLLNIDPSLILNEATPLNSPRTGLIESTKNQLTYRLFSGLLTADYFCNTSTPLTPPVNQEWNGVAGVSGISGIIEVTTTTNGPGSFKHTIVLKKASLKKGNSDFSLGDNYELGDLFTTN